MLLYVQQISLLLNIECASSPFSRSFSRSFLLRFAKLFENPTLHIVNLLGNTFFKFVNLVPDLVLRLCLRRLDSLVDMSLEMLVRDLVFFYESIK